MNVKELTHFGFGYGHTFANVDGMSIAELFLCHNLPHGSGIDYAWEYSRRSDGRLVLSNAYHGVNEWGMYVGSVGFSVIVDDLDDKDFRIVFHTKNRYWVEYWNLAEYFDEVFYWTMVQAEKEHINAIQ